MGADAKMKGISSVSGKKKLLLKSGVKGSNLSRQKILQLQRQAVSVKREKIALQKAEARKAVIKRVQTALNKRTHKVFDHSVLQGVQEGLVESIQSLGEAVTPLTLFMAAFTALSRSPEKHHTPYILTILSACAPRLSQGMLLHQLEPCIALTEQIIAENISSNHLAVAKSFKFAQQLVLSIEQPSMKVVDIFCRLEPSKLQVDTMKMFTVAFRKLLERSALYASPNTPSGCPVRSSGGDGVYVLNGNQKFFTEAMRRFTAFCVGNFTDAPVSVVASTTAEFTALLQRTISPYIVESVEGHDMIEHMVSNQLLELLKPHCQIYWSYALEILEALMNRVNYIKRTQAGDTQLLTKRFPSFSFLLRVLDKLRMVDDSELNRRIERTMVALGKGMTVREFVEIIPFDPRKVHEEELRGGGFTGVGSGDGDPWASSYVMNVLRRIASHDSLPFFVQHFFPLIQFTRGVILEYQKRQQVELATKWLVLQQQYWRLAAGFCLYPREITKDSFRDLAKQLVGLLSNPLLADTAATAIHLICHSFYELSTMESLDVGEEDEDGGATEGEEWMKEDQRERAASSLTVRAATKTSLDEDNLFLALNDPTWNRHVYHGISQAVAKGVCDNIIATFSANIMPKLCNTFETHDSTALLQAIRSFSRICTPDVMQVILKGILDLGKNIANQQQQSLGVDRDSAVGDGGLKKAGHAPLTTKRRMILDIACTVVGQLQNEHLERLFDDIIEPVLLDPAPESRLLQKKAYKLLYSMLEHRSKDVFPLFPRIAGILSVGRQHITVSGIKMRLRCIVWAIDACKMFYPDQLVATIRAVVGEAIALSRERSSETRALSMELLEKMQRYLVSTGSPVNTLLLLVVAGFSGKTPLMISGALVAMAKIVYVAHEDLPQENLNSAVSLGIRMMESSILEVRNAASMFARMLLKLMKRSAKISASLVKSLPKLLLAIALVTSQPGVSSNTRLQMRVLLEKCIKRFGYERLDAIFPIGSKNFLRYTHKMMKRDEKKEEKELQLRTQEKKNEFDRLFLAAAVKTGTEDDAGHDLLQAGGLTHFVSAHASPSFVAAAACDEEERDEFDNVHIEFHEGKLQIMTLEEKRKRDERLLREEMACKLLRGNHALTNVDALNEGAVKVRGKRSRAELRILKMRNFCVATATGTTRRH
ncbi:ribosomal rRNA-processing protein 12 [Trypanosoma vivax]|nr:ribosomal rRNA-processing protein 12 [Trypanosoma vivax]